MATITIDTADFVERLTRAKVSRPKAEAIVKSIEKDVKIDIDEDMSELVTKADLKAAFEAFEEKIETRIELSEERTTRRMWQQNLATLVLYIAVMAGLLRLMGVA